MFHENQVIAAAGIVTAYRRNTRAALLKALCQSGKTGTFQSLIQVMLQDGDITHVYILCGSSETELKKQAIEDTRTFNREYYDAGIIQVLFHQDFAKSTLDIENALLVLDESHMVQTRGQLLHKFLLEHGVTLDGDPKTLNEKNAFLLSVDATPYSEIAALEQSETLFEKHIQVLTPGEGYFGLADYKEKGLLLPTFRINDEPERFEALLLSVPRKFILVRLTQSKANELNEAALKRACKKHNFPVLLYTGEKTQVAVTRQEQKRFARAGYKLPCLEDAPATTTLIIVRGRLRAGKVVPKQHVGFVWEGAAKSKTDALVQGLPGRMCGYSFGDEKPLVFVPPSALVPDELDRVLSDDLPKTATNLSTSQTTNGKSVFSTA